MTHPKPTPRRWSGRGKVATARREVEKLRRRLTWRCDTLDGWQARWSWTWVLDTAERVRDDEKRLLEVVETWWPDQGGALRVEQATRAQRVENRVAELRAERRLLGLEPRPLDT